MTCEFINKLRGFYPFPSEVSLTLTEIREGDITIFEMPNGTVTGRIVHNVIVSFKQQIYGLNLEGPGADFYIKVADNRVVDIEFQQKWTMLDGYVKISVSSKEALQKLARSKLFIQPKESISPPGLKEGKLIINKVYLAYWAEIPGRGPSHLIPVYCFDVIVSGLVDGKPYTGEPFKLFVQATQ
jgi:hypothetical protein